MQYAWIQSSGKKININEQLKFAVGDSFETNFPSRCIFFENFYRYYLPHKNFLLKFSSRILEKFSRILQVSKLNIENLSSELLDLHNRDFLNNPGSQVWWSRYYCKRIYLALSLVKVKVPLANGNASHDDKTVTRWSIWATSPSFKKNHWLKNSGKSLQSAPRDDSCKDTLRDNSVVIFFDHCDMICIFF